MCGLAGCIGTRDTKTINRMLDALGHRGPNDRGVHVRDDLVLGHTRLSIVDVAGGHQPILAEGGRAGIICNGEVYNFRRLKFKLLPHRQFKTKSDSEVILHLYQEMGPACVEELDGMFAFAAYDGDDFVLARDPIGIKPLYYGYLDDKLYFSSELGAMSLAGLSEVHEFPAGHYYTPGQGFVQYYETPPVQDHLLTDIDETSRLIRRTFIEAVKKRLLADPEVPVGSFCSGGLDSSLVAAIAAERIPHLHTFVVGMEDEDGEVSDDVKAARIAAGHIGSTHHELIFTAEEYYEALPVVIKKLESYDPSLVRCAVPCYFTCKLAAEHVTVVLTGEGADELFTGYHYMKHFPIDKLNLEARRCIKNLHNINLQRADRMGMYFSLELRVPFLDVALVDLAMKIPPELKIREHNGAKIEKWILRKAFEETNYLPEDVLWRYKVQYTQGAGCESLGEALAEKMMSEEEYLQIKEENPLATINSREAAYYFKIFRQFHPQDSVLGSIGIWTGFDFAEERERVRGTVDGDLKHDRTEELEEEREEGRLRAGPEIEMRLTILGSGGCTVIPKPLCRCAICRQARNKGWPYERTGPSAFVHDLNLLIDAPAEIAGQLNRARVDRVDYLTFTHLDPDHVEGFRVVEQIALDFRSWRAHPEKRIQLLLPAELNERLRDIRSWYGPLIDFYEGQGFVKRVVFDDRFLIGPLAITAIRVARGSRFSFIYVLEQGGRRLVYAPCDVKPFPETRAEVQRPHLLVIQPGIFETNLRHGFVYPPDHVSRQTLYTFEQTLDLARRIKAQKVLFVHLEEYWNRGYDDYLALEAEFENVRFAHDGLEVRL